MIKEQTPTESQSTPFIEKSSSDLSNMGQPTGRPRVQIRYVDPPPQGGSTGTTLRNVEPCSGLNKQVKVDDIPPPTLPTTPLPKRVPKKSVKNKENQPSDPKVSELMQRFLEKRSSP